MRLKAGASWTTKSGIFRLKQLELYSLLSPLFLAMYLDVNGEMPEEMRLKLW